MINVGDLTDTLINMPGGMKIPAQHHLCSQKCERRALRTLS